MAVSIITEITKELTFGFKRTSRAKCVTLMVFRVRTIATVKQFLQEEHNMKI